MFICRRSEFFEDGGRGLIYLCVYVYGPLPLSPHTSTSPRRAPRVARRRVTVRNDGVARAQRQCATPLNNIAIASYSYSAFMIKLDQVRMIKRLPVHHGAGAMCTVNVGTGGSRRRCNNWYRWQKRRGRCLMPGHRHPLVRELVPHTVPVEWPGSPAWKGHMPIRL